MVLKRCGNYKIAFSVFLIFDTIANQCIDACRQIDENLTKTL